MKKLLVLGIMLIILTGCNKKVFDFEYTFDYAECYLNGEYQKYEIEQWTDYEGEQIQIKTKDGNNYLVSSNYCRLVKE